MREEIKKILDDYSYYRSIDRVSFDDIANEITALIERESEQKYTRKQVQKACAVAYQRGVDNRPYIEKFDKWVEDEPNPPKSEEV